MWNWSLSNLIVSLHTPVYQSCKLILLPDFHWVDERLSLDGLATLQLLFEVQVPFIAPSQAQSRQCSILVGSEFSEFYCFFKERITESICFSSASKSLFLLFTSTRLADMFFQSFMKPSTSLRLIFEFSNSVSKRWFSLLMKSSWSLSFWIVSLFVLETYSTLSCGRVYPPSYRLLESLNFLVSWFYLLEYKSKLVLYFVSLSFEMSGLVSEFSWSLISLSQFFSPHSLIIWLTQHMGLSVMLRVKGSW